MREPQNVELAAVKSAFFVYLLMQQRYRGIDLFCGIGGFRLAMEENDVQCVFSSDIDPFCAITIRQILEKCLKVTSPESKKKIFPHLIF